MNGPVVPHVQVAAMGDAYPFDYNGPQALQLPVLHALRRVVDPEMALTIVDLGLVHGVSVQPEEACVRMTMTSAACPVADLIVDDVVLELRGLLPAGCEIRVDLRFDPPWTPERMSARARRFMG